jgi:tRNA threonylcarbamoyladenosine biosynthesis protein TsaE
LQGFAKGLEIRQKVLSPTFLIMKKFKIDGSNFLYHFDCYRIKGPGEILTLGFKKIIQNPKNIVCIEWADRIKSILPENTIWINFEFLDKNKRKIQVERKFLKSLLK